MSVSRKKYLLGALAILVLFLFVLEFVPQPVSAAATRGSSVGDGWTETFTFFSGGATFVAKVIENQYTRALAFIILITVFFTQLIRFILSFSMGDSLSEEQKKMVRGITITVSILLSLSFLSTAGYGSLSKGNATPKLDNIPQSADKIIVLFGSGFWQFGIPILVALMFIGFPNKGDNKRSWGKRIGSALLAFGLITMFIQAKTRLGATSTAIISIILGIIILLLAKAKDGSSLTDPSGGGFGGGFGGKLGRGLGGFVSGFRNKMKEPPAIKNAVGFVKKQQVAERQEELKDVEIERYLTKQKENLQLEFKDFQNISGELSQLSNALRSFNPNLSPEDIIRALKPINDELVRLINEERKEIAFDKKDKNLDRKISRDIFFKERNMLTKDEDGTRKQIEDLRKTIPDLNDSEKLKVETLISHLEQELQLISREQQVISGSGMGGSGSGGLGAFIEADQLTRTKLLSHDTRKRQILTEIQKSILELEREAQEVMKQVHALEAKNDANTNQVVANFTMRVKTWLNAALNQLQQLSLLINQMNDSYRKLNENYNMMNSFILNALSMAKMRESETNQIYSEITNIHEEEEQTISTVQKIMDSVNERINNLYTEHEKIHSLFSRLHATFLENTTDFETTFTEFLNVVRSFENEFTIFKQEFENNISGAWQSLKNDKNLSAFMEKSYKQLADMKSSLEKELMQAKIVQEQVRQQILITNRTLQVIADKEALISQNKPIPAQWAVDQNTIRKIISVDLYRVMEIFKNNNFEDMEFTNLVRQEINHLEKEFDLQAPQQITPSVQMAS